MTLCLIVLVLANGLLKHKEAIRFSIAPMANIFDDKGEPCVMDRLDARVAK